MSGEGTDGRTVFVEAAVYGGAEGKPVHGLSCGDFRLYDNGRPADLISCKAAAALDVILVVDERSLALVPERAVRKDLERGLAKWRKDDRVALVSLEYGNLRWLHDFTNDPKAISETLQHVGRHSGIQSLSQPVFDAIAEATRRIPAADGHGSRAIMLLTNDRESRSQTKPDSAAEEALRADAGVYHVILNNVSGAVGVVGLPWPLPRPEIRGQVPVSPPSPAMASIVQRTGGEQMFTAASNKAFSTLLEILRSRYVLSFIRSTGKQGEFRSISVELADLARRQHPEALVRARAGYFISE